MATERLTVYAKNRITGAVATLLGHLPYSAVFPLTHEQQREYVMGLVPDEVARAIDLVARYDKDALYWTKSPSVSLVDRQHYRAEHVKGTYHVRLELNTSEPVVRHDYIDIGQHPHSQAICEWAQLRSKLAAQQSAAYSYFEDCVVACNSAGQVKRLLPDLVQYLPVGVQKSLAGAERISRVPKGFTPDPDKYEAAMVALATAHMVPEPDWDARYHSPQVHRFEAGGPHNP